MTSQDEETIWQVAGANRRKGRAAAGRARATAIHPCQAVAVTMNTEAPASTAAEADPTEVERCVERVRRCAEELRCSSFVAATLERLRTAWSDATEAASAVAAPDSVEGARLLCLGIGSVAYSEASRHQLALAHILAEELNLALRGWADPQMEAVDVAVGEVFGFAAKECKPPSVKAGEAMLLFMPHCDRALYEATLAANLPSDVLKDVTFNIRAEDISRLHLTQLVLIGNSFAAYDLRSLQQVGPTPAGGDWQLMQMVLPVLREDPLPVYRACIGAFNDLAVITFPADRLASLSELGFAAQLA